MPKGTPFSLFPSFYKPWLLFVSFCQVEEKLPNEKKNI